MEPLAIHQQHIRKRQEEEEEAEARKKGEDRQRKEANSNSRQIQDREHQHFHQNRHNQQQITDFALQEKLARENAVRIASNQLSLMNQQITDPNALEAGLQGSFEI